MPKLSKPITVPAIRATIRAIPEGKSRSFAAAELGDIATVKVAASRLNAASNANYRVTTPDKGITITITNNTKTNEQ